MRTLKSAFDELVEVLNKYDLYKKEDEVDMSLLVLSCMIDEVENRMECAKRTNIDIKEILFKKQQEIREVLGYDNEDILQRSVNDIDIAMDLDDNEPMTENWYGLFAPDLKPKVEVILPKGTLLEWVKTTEYFVAKEGAKAIVVEDYTNQSEYVKVEFTDELSNNQGNGGYDLIQFNVVEKVIEDTVELSGGGIPYRVCYHCAIKEEETVMEKVNGFWLCCDCHDETKDDETTETNLAKKDEIEKILISKWANFGMDIPSNFEDIVTFVFEDVCETADPKDWTSEDVIIGFRRWIESK